MSNKMRNSGTDVGKLTQWIGRKCRNYHPLEELALATRQTPTTKAVGGFYPPKQPVAVQRAGNVGKRVSVPVAAENILLYEAGGRVFRVTVDEIEPQSITKVLRVDCGF